MSAKAMRPGHLARLLVEHFPADFRPNGLSPTEKKRRQRNNQRKRAIAAGTLHHRIIDGVRHPLDCPCYDCLWRPET